jgi:hypothetical protein
LFLAKEFFIIFILLLGCSRHRIYKAAFCLQEVEKKKEKRRFTVFVQQNKSFVWGL